jgi:pyruvate kinase
MKRSRKVKILATLGPASSEQEQIKALHMAGADVFRINMSHASHDLMRELMRRIRAVEAEVGRPIGILADLQGPKLRLGAFENKKIAVEPGDKITLDSDDTPGNQDRVYLPHPEILEALEPGHRLLIDDGKVQLVALECTPTSCVAEVVAGTKLSDRKGVSLPDTELGIGALTDKDRADLEAVLETGEADWIALSFVQRPDDLAEVRKISRGKVAIMSKIEKPQAMARIDEIIELSDGLMVARGDLGVELPIESVPGIQKQLTRAARLAGKPCVVATQMLESMIDAPVPTRAEVSDVATAVYEGADAVMLSAESAAGSYPVEAVTTMNAIAEKVEQDRYYRNIINAQRPAAEPTGADAITMAARQISETLDLSCIVCFTASGTTGLRASRERPEKPILALSPINRTVRRLAIAWGVHCVTTPDVEDLDAMVDRACSMAFEEGFAQPGDRVLITAGVPLKTPGTTNMLRVAYVSSDGRGGA